MRIDNIKINGFGKIEDKEIEFKDGINIVYGENEAGKSTVLKFISSMLYGASKNKNGKLISDFDRYKPWNDGEFSGKIVYTLDDDSEYEIFREFKKKNPVIYNEFHEDISKKFAVDKSKGINFFEEQTGITEETFFNTTAIEQKEVKLNKLDTNNIVQKMTNLLSTGDDNISFKKSMDKLNKMQTESIGSDRTKQRPINIVNEIIEQLQNEKKKINFEIQTASDNSEKKAELNVKKNEEQSKKEFLKDVGGLVDIEKMNDAKIEVENNSLNEYFFRVNELREKINEKTDSEENIQKKFNKLLFGTILAILVIVAVLIFIFVRNIFVDIMAILPPASVIIFMIKKNHDIKKEITQSNFELNKEYDIAIQNYEKKKKEIDAQEKYFFQEMKKIQKEITDRYKKTLNQKFIEKTLNDKSNLEYEVELNQNMINEIDVEIRLLENEKANVDEKLQTLTRIEEKLEEQNNIKNELISLNESFNIAKECLEKAYEEAKHNISPKFQEKLCQITSEVTAGKYNNIMINDETGLSVEIENGAYMPIDLLSVGTIDEMYLSLRLSTLTEISRENLPIILDETFAYFDDNRLRNILLYLQDTNYDKQIIIFTCTKREINVLNDLKLEYNLISLEK